MSFSRWKCKVFVMGTEGYLNRAEESTLPIGDSISCTGWVSGVGVYSMVIDVRIQFNQLKFVAYQGLQWLCLCLSSLYWGLMRPYREELRVGSHNEDRLGNSVLQLDIYCFIIFVLKVEKNILNCLLIIWAIAPYPIPPYTHIFFQQFLNF